MPDGAGDMKISVAVDGYVRKGGIIPIQVEFLIRKHAALVIRHEKEEQHGLAAIVPWVIGADHRNIAIIGLRYGRYQVVMGIPENAVPFHLCIAVAFHHEDGITLTALLLHSAHN